MAEFAVAPIMKKIIDSCSDFLFDDFLKDQIRRKKDMKKELERLRGNHPKIQVVLDFAANQAQINNEKWTFNNWIWQLRDAIDEVDDVLDELKYMMHKQKLLKNTKETKLTPHSMLKSMKKVPFKIGKHALKIDPTLKRLKEAVKKLDEVSTTGVDTFLDFVQHAKQELPKQRLELHEARETVSSLHDILIGRGKEKELVMEWLRNPFDEHRGSILYDNISLLSIVGQGGMGKTTLLQHVHGDEMTKEFDRTMWVWVSNIFDVKKVISDMLESLMKERPHLDTLEALQRRLTEEVMGKKFLLVLDDVWEEQGQRSKWEYVLGPLAFGGFGSKILVTTRMHSVALMFAGVIKKKTKIVKLEGLEDDECLQLLNYHAFAGVKNSNDHELLRFIARQFVKKLLGSPLAAEDIGYVLSHNLDGMRWRTVLESNLFNQDSINFNLRLSYIDLPDHLKNCFAFSCMFPQGHTFDKDDLVRMWIALGFIQPAHKMTMEDIGRMYFDVLAGKALFDKVGDNYMVNVLIHESASNFIAQECSEVLDDEESSLKNTESVRHLFVRTMHPNILKKIEEIKHLHSLFLFDEVISNEDLCSALIEIFKASRSLRLLYVFAPNLKMMPEEIKNLVHLRYLKINSYNLIMMPRSLSKLYHLQYLIYDALGFPIPSEVDNVLPSDITNLFNLRYLSIDYDIPMLGELANLPPSLELLSIWKCQPELKER